jgi:hypothetical protein
VTRLWESSRLVLWAAGEPGMHGRVLCVLVAHADIETRQTWVGQRTIASHVYRVPIHEVAGWQIKRVSEAVQRLENRGLISVQRNGHRCPDGTFTNLYTCVVIEADSPDEGKSPHPAESPDPGLLDSPHPGLVDSPESGGQTQERQRTATTTSKQPGSLSQADAGADLKLATESSRYVMEELGLEIKPHAWQRVMTPMTVNYTHEELDWGLVRFLEHRAHKIQGARSSAGYILGSFSGYVADHIDGIRSDLEFFARSEVEPAEPSRSKAAEVNGPQTLITPMKPDEVLAQAEALLGTRTS